MKTDGVPRPDVATSAAKALDATYALWCEPREHDGRVEAVAIAMCDGQIVSEVFAHELEEEHDHAHN